MKTCKLGIFVGVLALVAIALYVAVSRLESNGQHSVSAGTPVQVHKTEPEKYRWSKQKYRYAGYAGARKIPLPRQRISESELARRYETAMDYYEGRNGRPMNIDTAHDKLYELAEKWGYAPAHNMMGNLYYNREIPVGGGITSMEMARHHWKIAAAGGSSAAKENINKIVRLR